MRVRNVTQIGLVRSLTKNLAFWGTFLGTRSSLRVSGGRRKWASPNNMRSMAARCLHLARVVRDAESKALLLKMAETWVKLAERLKAEAEQESVLALRGADRAQGVSIDHTAS